MAKRTTVLIAALMAAGLGAHAFAGSDERTLSFYHIHTKETLTVTYKRDGKFIPDAMKEIDHLMRDWRKNIEIKIDPETIDIIWEMHRELGSKEPVHVICGHRSRGTNEMLRRTQGGQASNSQHITGKAIDIAFPDIPAKQLRYSAMIRERGGVGYYPTSAIPFVHVDTSRVRHWPNMPRDELALLFPSGQSKHHPADGGAISKSDVARAKQRSPEVAKQVALFFEQRERSQAPIMVADASVKTPAGPQVAPPAPVERTAKAPEQKVALAKPADWKSETSGEPAPRLVAAPQLVERPARFTLGPSAQDRGKLEALVASAAEMPAAKPVSAPISQPQLVAAPALAQRPARKPAPTVVASLGPSSLPPERPSAVPRSAAALPTVSPAPAQTVAEAGSWATATEFDDDHPEELVYRPFPLAPLLTATASADDPLLSQLSLPDMGKTFEMLDDVGLVTPVRLRPGRQTAEMMWSKEFRGQAVDLAELATAVAAERPAATTAALNKRVVKTSAR